MPDTRLPNGFFATILAAAAAQCLHDFPLLPDRLASHFGPSGIPNGWMTKPQFFLTYALVLLPAFLVEFRVGRTISRKGDARLHLPNKQYWLAPERRAETFAYFETFFAWFGCAFLLLEVFAMGLAMRANFAAPPRLPTGAIISAIVAFVFFNIGAVFMMFRRFSKTGQTQLD